MDDEMSKSSLVIGALFLIGLFLIFLFYTNGVYAANPDNPDSINISLNETKTASSVKVVNISGGYIATFNITANIQNPRWKGFVGNVIGKFVLEDQSNSKLYDWSLSTLTGRIYATRNSTSPTWANVNCSNLTYLNQENVLMNNTNADDNLNRTFNYTGGATHKFFYVGSRLIPANSCPTMNTYVNNATQDNEFEEMALYDGYNNFYATIINSTKTGFDGNGYDFQMIVPENGGAAFSGSTAYYLYVELGG